LNFIILKFNTEQIIDPKLIKKVLDPNLSTHIKKAIKQPGNIKIFIPSTIKLIKFNILIVRSFFKYLKDNTITKNNTIGKNSTIQKRFVNIKAFILLSS
jgi:hypothetical protein